MYIFLIISSTTFFIISHYAISVLMSNFFHELFVNSLNASIHPILVFIEHDYDVKFISIGLWVE